MILISIVFLERPTKDDVTSFPFKVFWTFKCSMTPCRKLNSFLFVFAITWLIVDFAITWLIDLIFRFLAFNRAMTVIPEIPKNIF